MRGDECFDITLERFRPALPTVKYGNDFQSIGLDAVWQNIGSTGNYKFSCARNSSCSSYVRVLGKLFDACDDFCGDGLCRIRSVFSYEGANPDEMLHRTRRPCNFHCGGCRSRFFPQDCSQFLISP